MQQRAVAASVRPPLPLPLPPSTTFDLLVSCECLYRHQLAGLHASTSSTWLACLTGDATVL